MRFSIRHIIFAVVFSLVVFLSLVFVLTHSVPMFFNKLRPEHGIVYGGFILSYFITFIEIICTGIGAFQLIKTGQKNQSLLLAVLISCFEFLTSGVKFTFLLFEMGFTYRVGDFGIGINFVGVIFLIWYSCLKHEDMGSNQKQTGDI